MKKVLKIVTISVLALLVALAVLAVLVYNGQINAEEKYITRTDEEIKDLIRQVFYDDVGNPIVSIWEDKLKRSGLGIGIQMEILRHTGEDGFELYKIRNTHNGEYSFFLIEFEPYGHCVGYISQKEGKSFSYAFYPYPSPYKILDIPIEEGYIYFETRLGINYRILFATMRDGQMVTLDEEVYAKLTDTEHTHRYQFDYEIHRWVNYNYNSATGEWERGNIL